MHLYTVRSSDASPPDWRKSSYSWANGDCVEVASRSGGLVRVRDSTRPGGTVLSFGRSQWGAFVGDLRVDGDNRR